MNQKDYQSFPERLHSELALMNCIVNDGEKFLEVYSTVKASDFSQDPLATAWGWFIQMTDRSERITLHGLRQNFGNDPHYKLFLDLINLPDAEPLPFLVRQYAKEVEGHSKRARIARRIAQLHSMSEAGTEFNDLADEVQSLFDEVFSQTVTNSFRKADKIMEDIDAQLANPVLAARFKTGFGSLDYMLKGGFKTKQLVIVGGRTGGGKTVLAMNLAVNMALAKIPVAVFSLEMSDVDLLMRCCMAEALYHDTEEKAKNAIRNLPLWVDETSNITARSISAKIKLMKALKGVKVVVVDYLQLIEGEGHNRESRERIVAAMSRTLKLAAKDSDVLVIALSQLNEEGELRESRAIEQDADAVLYVMDNLNDDWFLRLCKHREGASHGPVKRMKNDEPGIPVKFYRENFRFSEA